MVDEERPYAEKIDGVVVSVPAHRITFYLEKVRGVTGREEVSVTPLVLTEERMKGVVEAIKEAVKGKKEKIEEALK